MNKNIIVRIGLIASTLIFSLLSITASVLVSLVLYRFWNIEPISDYILLSVIIPAMVAPPIIYFYGKLVIEITKTEGLLREQTTLLENALAEVKQLSGLLPICASCKDIRDDKGYWNAIERYISQRSDATFTHGLCPDCATRLYPNIKLPG